MALSDLQEIAPCRAEEVASRIRGLSALGLLELLPPAGAEPAQQILAPAAEDLDERVTLRPPTRASAVCEDALTLRPPQCEPLTLDLDDFADPPTTGIRLRPLPNIIAEVGSVPRSAKR